jgi:hypothetical protein
VVFTAVFVGPVRVAVGLFMGSWVVNIFTPFPLVWRGAPHDRHPSRGRAEGALGSADVPSIAWGCLRGCTDAGARSAGKESRALNMEVFKPTSTWKGIVLIANVVTGPCM